MKRINALHMELPFLALLLHEEWACIVSPYGQVHLVLVGPANFEYAHPTGGGKLQGIAQLASEMRVVSQLQNNTFDNRGDLGQVHNAADFARLDRYPLLRLHQ